MGLGGFHGRLLQNGFISAHYVPDGARGPGGLIGAFYEEIKPSAVNPEQWITPGYISPGDDVSQSINFLPGDDDITYSWHDLTNGNAWSVEKGVNTSYYDGSNADWVNEDQNGEGFQVRQYSSFDWTGVQATAGSTKQNAGFWPHTDMYSAEGQSGLPTQDLTNGTMTNSSSFTVNWYRCVSPDLGQISAQASVRLHGAGVSKLGQ